MLAFSRNEKKNRSKKLFFICSHVVVTVPATHSQVTTEKNKFSSFSFQSFHFFTYFHRKKGPVCLSVYFNILCRSEWKKWKEKSKEQKELRIQVHFSEFAVLTVPDRRKVVILLCLKKTHGKMEVTFFFLFLAHPMYLKCMDIRAWVVWIFFRFLSSFSEGNLGKKRRKEWSE